MLKTQRFPMPGQGAKARVGSTMRRVQRLQGMPLAHRVLGIDPGLNITGYGLIEIGEVRGATPTLIEGGTLDLCASPQRLVDGSRARRFYAGSTATQNSSSRIHTQ
jgi:hypothetical protein